MMLVVCLVERRKNSKTCEKLSNWLPNSNVKLCGNLLPEESILCRMWFEISEHWRVKKRRLDSESAYFWRPNVFRIAKNVVQHEMKTNVSFRFVPVMFAKVFVFRCNCDKITKANSETAWNICSRSTSTQIRESLSARDEKKSGTARQISQWICEANRISC